MQKMRKMKDSGIEWIGEIPEGWEIIPVKYLAKYNYDTLAESCSPDFEFSYIDIGSVTYTDGITNYQNFKFKDAPSRARRIVHSGDILVSTVRTYLRAVACVNEHQLPQIASTGFLVLQADISKIHPHFLMYSVLSDNFICKVEANSVGISYPAINASQIVHFKLPIPQLSEQFLLVTYLDRQCSEIDALLSKTLSSIEEYKKLKQAVITQAVTKGVRGEREMKDSGVEWIGEIPKEWRKTQLRHCATIKSGITLGKSYSKDTVLIERPYLRVANVQGGYVDLNDLATIEVTPDEDLKYRLHSGDVLMTEGGDRDKLGRGCVWHGEIEPCLHQNHVFAVQTNETILLPEFLEYLTASDVGRSYFDVTAIKTTNLACTSSSKVLAFTIPLPPIEEQIEIVNFIKKRSLELNKLIMKKELLVQELENYKKSLIYEVVTGKREV